MVRLRLSLAGVFAIEAVAFVLSAYLHTGNRVAFLLGFFHDPAIRGAPIVEAACGLLLGAAALLSAGGSGAAWAAAVVAHITAIVADAIGMILIAVGAGPDSPFNYLFHRAGVAVLVLVLGCLVSRPARNALGREGSAPLAS
jgi:hypothetical protein